MTMRSQEKGKPNWENGTIWTGDNLSIMRGLNGESVDLVYLDPPFNSNKNYKAPIGSEAAGAEFEDMWTFKPVDKVSAHLLEAKRPLLWTLVQTTGRSHSKGMGKYLLYMASRLIEIKRLLKPTGSVYLHCDPNASHYLKMLMDVVFGRANFRNEIVWHYYNKYSSGKAAFGRNYDQLLFYVSSKRATFTPQREPRETPVKQIVRENVGGVLKNKRGLDGKVMYRTVTDRKVDAVWRMPCVQPASKERTGYPTQKPLALLRRIIEASSNPGDVVLDPFCGCATACVAAEGMPFKRQWIGIDISPEAVNQVRLRMKKELGLFDIHIHRTDQPERTDGTDEAPKGFKTRDFLPFLYKEQDGVCPGCNSDVERRHMSVDHIIPRAKGGSDRLDNLHALCKDCNSRKGTKSWEEFLVSQSRRGYIRADLIGLED